MARHLHEGFHGFIGCCEFKDGRVFDELFSEAVCPVCGKHHFCASRTLDMDEAIEGSDIPIEDTEPVSGLFCDECASKAEKYFGKEVLLEFYKDGDWDFLEVTLIELHRGVTFTYNGNWCGPAKA